MARTPIQTANARRGGRPIEIPVDLGPPHGEVVYAFSAVLGSTLAEHVNEFQEAAKSADDDPTVALGAMMTLLDEAAVGDTAQRIAEDWKDKRLGIPDITAIGLAFIEEATATVDPTKRPSSSDGSPTTGESSTDGAPPEG